MQQPLILITANKRILDLVSMTVVAVMMMAVMRMFLSKFVLEICPCKCKSGNCQKKYNR